MFSVIVIFDCLFHNFISCTFVSCFFFLKAIFILCGSISVSLNQSHFFHNPLTLSAVYVGLGFLNI